VHGAGVKSNCILAFCVQNLSSMPSLHKVVSKTFCERRV